MIDTNLALAADGDVLQELEADDPRLFMNRVRRSPVAEILDDAREARLALYEARYEAGLGIFDGEPASDAVSVHELECETG